MSVFYDEASLVVVPSGYKSGKIYAQKPLTTDGQLTFTRASTATRVNASGLIEEVASGVPRLDYLGSSCPKILLEPQRSNLNIESQTFGAAAWDPLNIVVSDYIDQLVAPDGTTTADLAIPNTTSDSYHGYQLGSGRPSLTGGTVYTYSVFAKANGYSKIRVQNFSAGVRAQFDLSTGTLINQSGTTSTFITPYGNGWYRVGFTYTQATTVSAYWNLLVVSTDDNTSSAPAAWAGNGTSSVSFWGSQIEAGAYPTSYVKTTTAAVTRLADQAAKTGISGLIGQTEGTIFVEFQENKGVDAANIIFSLSDGTSANLIYYNLEGPVVEFIASSSIQAIKSGGINLVAGTNKIAVYYKANDFGIYLNGVSIFTDTTGSVGAMSKFNLGSFFNDAFSVGTPINQALLFKTRLSNAKLAELTTL